MTQVASTAAASDDNDRRDAPSAATRVAHLLFYASATVVLIKSTCHIALLEKSQWPETLLVLTATVCIVSAASRILPLQNVVLAATIAGGIGAGAHTLAAALGVAFGQSMCNDIGSSALLNLLPWPVPFVWAVTILTSRGVAQLLLRRRRNASTYGLQLLAATTALCVLFASCADGFCASIASHSLSAHPTESPHGYVAPATKIFGWFVITLLALTLATPALLDKKPGTRPIIYQPLRIWIVLCLLFAAGTLRGRQWTEAGLALAGVAVISISAWYTKSRNKG